MKRAAFFFGAGISKASKKPVASDITRSALQDQWYLAGEMVFLPGPKPNLYRVQALEDSVTPVVQQFLLKLKDMGSDYITELSQPQTAREIHYEDLFSLAEQAFRSESDYVPNLAVVEFLRRLRKETSLLHSGFKGTAGGTGLSELAETACDFLHWVVHHKLFNNEGPRSGLDSVTDTAKQVDELDIFTLNHDLLVEGQLRATDLDYEDGFADRNHGEFSVFSGWPECTRKRVRLFKLHGSINWYPYDFPGWARQYAIPDNDPSHCHDQNGRILKPVGGKAAFLSGTVVKEQRYGIGLFGDLFSEFRRHLGRHKHLICCGYGFGDTGINNRIYQWVCDSLDGSNTLIILSQDSEQTFFEDKPFWMQNLQSQGRVILVNKWLQCCSPTDLERFFDDIAA